jgi:hypothetical protein
VPPDNTNLMPKRASEWIPHNILVAAEKAGLSLPLWYVGRNNGHDAHARKKTLADLANEARRRESELQAAPKPPAEQ